MRPFRLLLAFTSCLLTIVVLFYLAASKSHVSKPVDDGTHFRTLFNWRAPSSLFPPSAVISLTDDNTTFFLARPANFGPLLPSKGLSGQLWIGSGFGDDNLGRGIVTSAEGELGCSDVPGWNVGRYRGTLGRAGDIKDETQSGTAPQSADGNVGKVKRSNMAGSEKEAKVVDESLAGDDGTDDHLHHPLVASNNLRSSTKPADNGKKSAHADIQSIQESAEIAGKVVLLSRGGCGFLEKVKWAQRRGGTALIVGDDIRGGPLVTMYARGDTSNVTIPALFTSHTTAHLLSSLIPSGGLLENLSPDDITRLGVALGDRQSQATAKSNSNGKSKESDSQISSKHTAKYEHNSKSLLEETVDTETARPKRKSWLRSIFSSSSAGETQQDSRRPPSSGNIDWVVQQDFEEDEVTKGKVAKQKSTSTKAVAPAKIPTKSPGDGFIIGVQDWRDPDLVDSSAQKPEVTQDPQTESLHNSKSSNHISPEGGSITPGSGDYSTHRQDQSVSLKAAKQQDHESKGATDDEKKGDRWLGRLSWSNGASDESQTDAQGTLVRPTTANKQEAKQDLPHGVDRQKNKGGSEAHEGLWVTLQPTSMSSSPFFDTLLVLVVSPLVTLTVVYALLLLRSRIRRRRWRAPKSVVERLPVRTYHTIAGTTGATNSSEGSPLLAPSLPSPTTPLLHSGARPISQARQRPRSRTLGEVPVAGSSLGRSATPVMSLDQVQEKREAGLAEWRRRYGGKQKECVVCLEEYVDGVSRVMSLPCGHEFHAECM